MRLVQMVVGSMLVMVLAVAGCNPGEERAPNSENSDISDPDFKAGWSGDRDCDVVLRSAYRTAAPDGTSLVEATVTARFGAAIWWGEVGVVEDDLQEQSPHDLHPGDRPFTFSFAVPLPVTTPIELYVNMAGPHGTRIIDQNRVYSDEPHTFAPYVLGGENGEPSQIADDPAVCPPR